MSHQPLFLGAMGFAALQLVFWGFVIRMNGPSGFVHGFGDLSRLSAEQHSSIGRCVGNCLFSMAAAILGFGLFMFFYGGGPIATIAAATVLIAVLVAVAVYMKQRLSHMAKPATEAHRGG